MGVGAVLVRLQYSLPNYTGQRSQVSTTRGSLTSCALLARTMSLITPRKTSPRMGNSMILFLMLSRTARHSPTNERYGPMEVISLLEVPWLECFRFCSWDH